jgi:hypothetical protein
MPGAFAVAVAPVLARLSPLARARAHQALHVGLHQALRHEADHLAQQIPVGALLKQFGQCHPVVGHRFCPQSG